MIFFPHSSFLLKCSCNCLIYTQLFQPRVPLTYHTWQLLLLGFFFPWEEHYKTCQGQAGSRVLHNLIMWDPHDYLLLLFRAAICRRWLCAPRLKGCIVPLLFLHGGPRLRGCSGCHGCALQPPRKPWDLSQRGVQCTWSKRKAILGLSPFDLTLLVHHLGWEHWLTANCADHTGAFSFLGSGEQSETAWSW